MRVGTRLFLMLSLPLMALMALFGYLGERAASHRLEHELKREGRGLVVTARAALEDYLRDGQIEDIRELAERIGGYERVLGIRVFTAGGDLICQSSSLNNIPPTPSDEISKAIRAGRLVETSLMLEGKPMASFVFPLTGDHGTTLGAAQFLQVETYVLDQKIAFRRFLTGLGVVMIVAAGMIILLATRMGVSRPIEVLVHRLRGIGTATPVAFVPLVRRDEIGRLAQEVATMCERLEAAQQSLLREQAERRVIESQLRKAQRLASLGRLSAGLAHEIGTPLNVIGGRAQNLRRKLSGNEVADRNLKIIITQIERITRIVRGMLDFSRTRELRPANTEIDSVLRKVLELMAQRFDEAGIQVEVSLPGDLPGIQADPDQIYEVFLNLATNALDAMPHGGKLRIGAEVLPVERVTGAAGEGSFLKVSMEDTGTGIPPEILDRIFDPFFTTKEVGRGTGLGLSVSYGIVQEHGGWIDVVSTVGQGTRMVVHLPVIHAVPVEYPTASLAVS